MHRTYRRSRQAVILLSSITLIGFIIGPPPRAIDDNLTKGATNNHVFEAGMWGESIDNLNGGLNLTIPLGPEFRVSPDLSYQLTLTYSSKLWAMTSANLTERMDSRLAGNGQAGLGFSLQFGRRYLHAGTPDCQANEKVFEDATGAAHPLPFSPSPDGSYLRTLGSNKIQRPDGVILTLGPEVPDLRPSSLWSDCEDNLDPNVDTHTNGYRGEYVTNMAGKDLDSSGNPKNWVNIQYETQPGKRHLISSITDSQGRTISFTNRSIGNIGVVESVTLPAFGGGNSTYVFEYEDPNDPEEIDDLFYAVVGEEALDPDNPPAEFNVALLKSITFPHGYQMSFEYSDPNERGGENFGLLEARVLPTGARIEYDYELYSFQHNTCLTIGGGGGCVSAPPPGEIPQVIDEDDCSEPSNVISYQSRCFTSDYPGTVALKEKRVVLAANQPAYTWTWERRPYTSVELNGSRKPLSNPWKVVMRDPYGNDTVTYYWAQLGGRNHYNDPSGNNEPWWRNSLVAAVEYYRGTSSVPLNLVRKEIQTWEDRTETAEPYHVGNYKRIKETRTIHLDNGGQTVRTVHDDWDGFGHYRATTEYGFDGLPYRIRRTGYNCDQIDPNGACVPRVAHVGDPNDPGIPGKWVLDTYSFSETLDPNGQVLQRSEHQFDDLGYLKTQRDRLTLPSTPGWDLVAGNASAASAGDIVTEYCYEGETSCGAPAGPRTGNLYSKGMRFGEGSPGVHDSKEVYTYEGPYLKSKQIDGMSWMSEDKDVDPHTGLTEVTRDQAGIQTTFDYDLLGRLTMVTPVSVNGVEQPAVLSYPDIHTTELTQSASPSNFIYSRFSFDGLGRLERVDKRHSNGTLASQVTRYNEAGRLTFQSEWFDPNQIADPNNPLGTTFDFTDPLSDPSDPTDDPFGRVRKTTTADGKVTRTNYAGLSNSVIVEGIKGRCGGEIKAATSYEKDAFGRLSQVISARGADVGDCGPTARRDGADAEYTYDRLDRMTRVRLEGEDQDGATIAQLRHFAYDTLGRRLSETNPENGTVTYGAYDVLGNVLEKQDAAGHLFVYEYDLASRPTYVRLGNKPLATMTYDQSGFGYSAGKLTTVVSNDDSGQPLVQEERRYNGLNGRLSERKWRIRSWDPTKIFNQQPWITMGYDHDSLGLLHDLTYPEDPNVARQVLHPTYNYSNGHLTWATDSVRGMLVESVGYNPAGGVELIRTRGGVETLIVPDDRNRPASITVTGPPAPYCGDGTCNTSESCESCVPDCGECPGGGEGPGDGCQQGQICEQGQAWIPSAQRPIGQSPAELFSSGPYEYDGAGNISRIGSDSYRYDTLNRLVMAEIVTPTSNIENVFWSYDSFGNMLTQLRQDDAPNPWSILHEFTVDSERNQIGEYSANGVPLQAAYGDTGAMTQDGVHDYFNDLRNRLLEVYEAGTSAPLVARYTYDHEGYRLSKFDSPTGTTTFYFRDLDGRVLSEFRRPADPQAKAIWSKDYVYAAGRHVAMIENDRPATPGRIEVETNSYGESPAFVTLSWEAVSDLDLLQYQIYRKDSSQNEQMFVHQNLASTTWTDSDANLVIGQAYTYRITALDQAANESERSEPAVVTPGDNATPGTPVLMLPTSGDQWVRLKWSKPSSPDVWSYRLYRKRLPNQEIPGDPGDDWSQQGGDFRFVEVTDRTVSNGEVYRYQVKAVDTAGLVSPPSNEQPASPNDNSPPSPPQGLFAIPGTTQVELGWQASISQDATGTYRVYRSNASISDPSTPFSLVSSTMFLDTVSPLTTYHYRVKSIDDDGNLSDFSAEIVVQTRDPAVGVPQFSVQSWDYCGAGAPFTCCLPQNLGTCGLDENQEPAPGDATHKNYVATHAQGLSGDEVRVYRRRHTSDPLELAAVLPTPGAGASEYPLLVPQDWQYAQFFFNPADACVEWEYRVSGVNSAGSESALSAPRAMPASILIPENLSVPAEPLPKDLMGNPNHDIPPMANAAKYGLTLQWSGGNSSCAASFAGYHVYRSRRMSGHLMDVTDPNAPPIRLTREPITMQQWRVQWLPHVTQDPWGGPLFPGLSGNRLSFAGITYALTAADMLGNESFPSTGVFAHSDSEDFTRRFDTSSLFDNYEVDSPLKALPLDPTAPPGSQHAVTAPGSIDGNLVTWAWHYGHDALNIGPEAGNWVLMKWGNVQNEFSGHPNEIMIGRQVGADPN